MQKKMMKLLLHLKKKKKRLLQTMSMKSMLLLGLISMTTTSRGAEPRATGERKSSTKGKDTSIEARNITMKCARSTNENHEQQEE